MKDGQAAHLCWHVGTAAHHVAVQGGSDGEFYFFGMIGQKHSPAMLQTVLIIFQRIYVEYLVNSMSNWIWPMMLDIHFCIKSYTKTTYILF